MRSLSETDGDNVSRRDSDFDRLLRRHRHGRKTNEAKSSFGRCDQIE